jgi:hypothetical protein
MAMSFGESGSLGMPTRVLDSSGAEGYKAAMFETRPLSPVPASPPRRRRSAPYWIVTVTRTEVGFAIHETRGDARKLRAVIVDEREAWDYAERRAEKPWRVLEGETRPVARPHSRAARTAPRSDALRPCALPRPSSGQQ